MLLGRVAVVTGGATGIGRAIAQRLAREGARVVVGDVDAEGGSATARGIVERGGQALFVPADMTRRDDVRAMVRSAVDEYGGLHVLVNNAVRFVFGHVAGAGTRGGDGLDREVSDADWDAVFRTNVVGYARAIEEAVPYFRENSLEGGPVYDNDQGEGVTRINAASRGSVVNIASVSGYIAQPSFVPYNASKGAVLQLTRCCAMDLAPDKIRVNAICPGTIETQGSYGHMRHIGLSLEEGRKVFGDSCLLKRQAAPEEIANGAAWLASDEASFMTGECMVMDGGGTV